MTVNLDNVTRGVSSVESEGQTFEATNKTFAKLNNLANNVMENADGVGDTFGRKADDASFYIAARGLRKAVADMTLDAARTSDPNALNQNMVNYLRNLESALVQPLNTNSLSGKASTDYVLSLARGLDDLTDPVADKFVTQSSDSGSNGSGGINMSDAKSALDVVDTETTSAGKASALSDAIGKIVSALSGGGDGGVPGDGGSGTPSTDDGTITGGSGDDTGVGGSGDDQLTGQMIGVDVVYPDAKDPLTVQVFDEKTGEWMDIDTKAKGKGNKGGRDLADFEFNDDLSNLQVRLLNNNTGQVIDKSTEQMRSSRLADGSIEFRFEDRRNGDNDFNDAVVTFKVTDEGTVSGGSGSDDNPGGSGDDQIDDDTPIFEPKTQIVTDTFEGNDLLGKLNADGQALVGEFGEGEDQGIGIKSGKEGDDKDEVDAVDGELIFNAGVNAEGGEVFVRDLWANKGGKGQEVMNINVYKDGELVDTIQVNGNANGDQKIRIDQPFDQLGFEVNTDKGDPAGNFSIASVSVDRQEAVSEIPLVYNPDLEIDFDASSLDALIMGLNMLSDAIDKSDASEVEQLDLMDVIGDALQIIVDEIEGDAQGEPTMTFGSIVELLNKLQTLVADTGTVIPNNSGVASALDSVKDGVAEIQAEVNSLNNGDD